MSSECDKCGEHCLDCRCTTVMVSGCPVCEKCEKYSIHCKCGERCLDCKCHEGLKRVPNSMGYKFGKELLVIGTRKSIAHLEHDEKFLENVDKLKKLEQVEKENE